MDHHKRNHISEACDILTTADAHPLQSLNADELVIALSDLATLARLIGESATQIRRKLAAWTTVDAHLQQADQHAADLSRSLNHACATFAFTSSPTAA